MPKSKIVSSIIALVLGLCVVVFTIAYFSINGKHNREGYTFEGDFFNGTATLIGMENPKVMFNDSKNKQIPGVLHLGIWLHKMCGLRIIFGQHMNQIN